MSEFHADAFAAKPSWSQGMLVLPDLVCIDVRLWVSSNRGHWSLASQVAVGSEREIAHLTVGPDMPFTTIAGPARAGADKLDRLLAQYVNPFPLRSA